MKFPRIEVAVRTATLILASIAAGTFAETDLTVGFIQRGPAIDYVYGSTDPTREGWPAAGSVVTWRGQVLNLSSSSQTVNYQWKFGGANVANGAVSVPANGSAFVELPRVWSFDRSEIELVLDPTNTIVESMEGNNRLRVYSDALAVGFWVEQSEYDFYRAHQKDLAGVQSNCWANWAQRVIDIWNTMHANAITPSTPQGVLDRVRLDKIVVVPDGALPLRGWGYATNNPDTDDRSIDMQWGFPWDPKHATVLRTSLVDSGNVFFHDNGVVHELYHARYAVDNYGFNIHANPGHLTRDTIHVTEGGVSIVGTRYLPQVREDMVYETRQQGLMSDHGKRWIDTYAAMAWNQIKGRRAVSGNMNAPGNFGVYLNDLPRTNLVRFVDAATGTPLAGASVSLYRSSYQNGVDYYRKKFDGTPDLLTTTDAQGWADVGHNPFSDMDNLSPWMENTVALVRVSHHGDVRYVFLEVGDFNMEKWRGNEPGRVVVPVEFLAQANVPQPSTDLRITAGNGEAFLVWNPSSDAIEQKVFQSLDGTSWTEVALLPGSAAVWLATGLVNGTTYRYRVIPYKGGNNGWPTNTVSVVPRSAPGTGAAVKAQYRIVNTNPTDNGIQAVLRIQNTGASAVPYSELELRYYYSGEGVPGGLAVCDWAQLGTSFVNMSIVSLPAPVSGADRYLKVSFAAGAGSLGAGRNSGDIQLRLHKLDWSNFSEADDWSRDPSKTNFADWNRVEIRQNGTTIWGSAP
jgi:hypothetical protein